MDQTTKLSQDNIFHIANILKSLRNSKQNNEKEIDSGNIVEPKDFFAVFTISEEKNYHIRAITTTKRDTLLLELSNTVTDLYKFSSDRIKYLRDNGWQPPYRNSLNYSKLIQVNSEKECNFAAAEMVATFIMVFDFAPTDGIHINIDELELDYDLRKLPMGKKVKFYLKTFLVTVSDMIQL